MFYVLLCRCRKDRVTVVFRKVSTRDKALKAIQVIRGKYTEYLVDERFHPNRNEFKKMNQKQNACRPTQHITVTTIDVTSAHITT